MKVHIRGSFGFMDRPLTRSDISRLKSWSYGGNTICTQVQIPDQDEFLLLDAGSGLNSFSQKLVRSQIMAPRIHILLTHLTTDHLQGLPWLSALRGKHAHVTLYGGHPVHEMERACSMMFGLSLIQASLPPNISFAQLIPGQLYQIAGASVRVFENRHPGQSFAFRIDAGGRSLVSCTDAANNPDQFTSVADFMGGAQLVLFEAMYSLADTLWLKPESHRSNSMVGVELCKSAGVEHMLLYHHLPTTDAQIDSALATTQEYAALAPGGPLVVGAAYDGQMIEL